MVGIDYHGERVLAAYEPVAQLGLGVVAKVDLAEIRAPFFRAAAAVIGVATLLIALGTVLFIRLTNPMVAALREREQALELILASTGEGIFGMDVDGRCTFANRSALSMLGYNDEAELLSRDMHTLMHHSHADGTPRNRQDCAVHQALSGNSAILRDDETLWRADGTDFSAEYRAYPMRRDGAVVGAMVTFVDITQRKQRELQLLHAQKMDVLGRLTGGIAHDFNNLLTIILGNLRLLREEKSISADSECADIVDDALSAAQDGADLTRRLSAFSRKQALRSRSIEVNDFLRNAKSFLRRVIGEGINLELCLGDENLPICTDAQQLNSAILNLAINAADAMPSGGILTIGTKRTRIEACANAEALKPGPYVVISVRDTGCGMPEDVVRRAAEPFFTTKQPGEGSGLGLSMVYGFAKQSGGSMHVRSSPGRGTEVSLFLPEGEAGTVVAEAEEPTAIPTRADTGERVLVVEDEPRLRKFACRSLVARGYSVLEATDAKAAKSILASRPDIDVLFSDIVMPGPMNGMRLASWAVQHRPGLRVLLTTGFSDDFYASDAMDRAAFPVLDKPYTRERLLAAIRALLDGPDPERVRRRTAETADT